jgi:hypothetical protein
LHYVADTVQRTPACGIAAIVALGVDHNTNVPTIYALEGYCLVTDLELARGSWIGHASIQTTLDTYGRVAPGLQHDAALAFDKRLSGAVKPVVEAVPVTVD